MTHLNHNRPIAFGDRYDSVLMSRKEIENRVKSFSEHKLEWLAVNSKSHLWRECACEALSGLLLKKGKVRPNRGSRITERKRP